jgi:[FeFe] hydrogenase H-cluster maturation GTPase HydF
MQSTPKNLRIHIGIYGRRNVGKSSLLNTITRQHVSIVSVQAGTTTDPVEKPMELLPLGPVLFIDTAGIDDSGDLGKLRLAKTRKMFARTDLGIIVTEANAWTKFEDEILAELKQRKIPIIIALNKTDLFKPDTKILSKLQQEKAIKILTVSTKNKKCITTLHQAILDMTPENFFSNIILRDLVKPNDIVIQVIPIDREAPKGRLLLPQAQAIRDALDGDIINIVIKETELAATLKTLTKPPALVVTDSSAFKKVTALLPPEIPLTGYSILFTRCKGDLTKQAAATLTISQLKPGDKVLIAEACSHHPICDDIGRCKIPRALNNKIGGELDFTVVQGHDFPDDLTKYKLVVHCGACMFNRRAVLSRLLTCQEAGVPMTNYGLVFAYCMDIFDKVLQPFSL